MNLILISKQEFDNASSFHNGAKKIVLTFANRRAKHMIDVLKAEPGSVFRAGIINGNIGELRVRDIDKNKNQLTAVIEPENFRIQPPTALAATLIIALPRPKMARRMLQLASECGVKNIHLINSYKVEKSYWSSPLLKADAIQQTLLLGLEQSVDTQLPQVHLHKRFRPFVEDSLPDIINGKPALVLHPYAKNTFHSQQIKDTTLTVTLGPEGGFIPYEIEKLQQAGCLPVSWGPRVQRSETMLGLLLGSISAD